MTRSRDEQITRFLIDAGWGDADRRSLAGDASFRRYDRLHQGGDSAVLMDAPPPEDVKPFIAISQWLRQHSFLAPKIFAMDMQAGLLLLEDLGDDTFLKVLRTDPAHEPTLYEAAVDVLLKLHQLAPPCRIDLPDGSQHRIPVHDAEALQAGIAVFSDWYLPALTGGYSPQSARQLSQIFTPLIEQLQATPSVLALRDYHAENLMWLPSYPGTSQVALLDYQDASHSHPAYDLVSLLQDARRDVDPALEEAMLKRYIAGRASGAMALNEAAFRRDYAIAGAQRNIRILGVFTRLARRDGKTRYLDFMDRVWALLDRNLAVEPTLAPLRDWLDGIAPVNARDLHKGVGW